LALDGPGAFFNDSTWLEIYIRHIDPITPGVIDDLDTGDFILMKPDIPNIHDIRANLNLPHINYTTLLVRIAFSAIHPKFRILALKQFQIFVKFPRNITLILLTTNLLRIQNIMTTDFGFVVERIKFAAVFQNKSSFPSEQLEFL
jgi:hypothetical protein